MDSCETYLKVLKSEYEKVLKSEKMEVFNSDNKEVGNVSEIPFDDAAEAVVAARIEEEIGRGRGEFRYFQIGSQLSELDEFSIEDLTTKERVSLTRNNIASFFLGSVKGNISFMECFVNFMFCDTLKVVAQLANCAPENLAIRFSRGISRLLRSLVQSYPRGTLQNKISWTKDAPTPEQFKRAFPIRRGDFPKRMQW